MLSRESEKVIMTGYRHFKILENYKEIAEKVKQIVLSKWPNAELYIFGSTVKGNYTATSDIDLLIVLDDRPDREEEYMVKAEVYAQIDAPIELHVASRSEFEKWYKKFIGKDLVRI
jgi:predicted nucleotidyltransferase